MALLVLVLLIAAVVLFILAAIGWRGWCLAIGLACFAGAFLAPLLLARLS